MRIQVDVARDAGGNEAPTRLGFDNRSLVVTEVLDRWPGDGYRYFKVKAEDGALYIVRHDQSRGEWELTMFARRGTVDKP